MKSRWNYEIYDQHNYAEIIVVIFDLYKTLLEAGLECKYTIKSIQKFWRMAIFLVFETASFRNL